MNLRKTKIVATEGPSVNTREMLMKLIDAGVDVIRLNFSHGTPEGHAQCAKMIREISTERHCSVGILCDLQGPKIRIGRFETGKITVNKGDSFILDANCQLGNQKRVGLDYKTLPHEVSKGTILLLDDGRMVMQVNKVLGDEIFCTLMSSGTLSDNKGINKQGGGLAAEALTDKDREDIISAVTLGADFIAISFPRSAEDIHLARQLIVSAGGYAHVVAKIERAEAINALDEILDACDSVMVARGDLGVEVGDALVPSLQKRIIRLARAKNKSVITATQMMESMIASPIPTRAEVSDVANAVLDGTDAVMLSAETATGQYPLETIAAVHRVCIEAENEQALQMIPTIDVRQFTKVDESIAMAASYVAEHLPIKGVVAFTQSGASVLWLSRSNILAPIYAASPESLTRRRLKLYRGVYPLPLRTSSRDSHEVIDAVQAELTEKGALRPGDLILVMIGEPFGQAGSTNTLKTLIVGSH